MVTRRKKTTTIDKCGLGQEVMKYRAMGMSLGAIRSRLEHEHNISIARTTLHDWIRRRGVIDTKVINSVKNEPSEKINKIVDMVEGLIGDLKAEFDVLTKVEIEVTDPKYLQKIIALTKISNTINKNLELNAKLLGELKTVSIGKVEQTNVQYTDIAVNVNSYLTNLEDKGYIRILKKVDGIIA